MEFQTRSESDGIAIHPTLKSAIEEARTNESIWKISFSLPTGERVRLVRMDTFSDRFELRMMDLKIRS